MSNQDSFVDEDISGSFKQDIEKQVDRNTGVPLEQTATNKSSFRYDNKNIYINDQAISRDEFMYALGGSFNVGPTKITNNTRNFADPVPAGIGAFSIAILALGLVNMHARDVSTPNVLIGLFLGGAGLSCLVTSIFCFIMNNTWGCCTFMNFAGFYISYGVLLGDFGDNMRAAYSTQNEYNQAIALYILPWVIFSFILWLCTLKSTVALCSLLGLVWFFLLLLDIAQFTGSVRMTKASGFFTILCSMVGFYICYSGMAEKDNSYYVVKPIYMPHTVRPGQKH